MLAVTVVSLLVGSAARPSTAIASVYSPPTTQELPGWYQILDRRYYYAPHPGGASVGPASLTGRWMAVSDFDAMTNRMARGVQSLGTGAGSGYSANAANGVGIAEKLKTVATGAGTIATVRSLKGDTLGLMSRLKSFGLLKSLGTIGLAATSFEVGWKTGSLISDLFGFGQDGADAEETSASDWSAKEETMVVQGENLCLLSVDATPYSSGACAGKGATMPMPTNGAIVGYSVNGGSSRIYGTPGPNASAENGGECGKTTFYDAPAGAIFVQGGKSLIGGCSGSPAIRERAQGVWLVPLAVAHLPGEAGGSPSTTKTTSAQTPENQPAAEGIVKECMVALACATLGGWWWNHDPEAKEATHYEGFHMGLDPVDALSVQIPVPEKGEKVGPYAERLEALDLVVEPVALGEAFIDPRVGPEGVSATVPHIGANVEPETKVRVRYNPAGAPEGSEATESEPKEEGGSSPGVGGWSPPAIPPLDMPGGIPSPCTVFPFGVLCWLGEALAQFNTSGVCPHFSAPVADTGSNFDVTLCGETSETIMGYLRPAILLVFTVGVGFLFARATKAVGGD